MNQVSKISCASVLVLFCALSPAIGQEEAEPGTEAPAAPAPEMTREERRAAYEAMSDEEKAAVRERVREARQKRRAEIQAMSPEERAAWREEQQKRIESMTPEQQERIRKRQERMKNANQRPRQKPETPKDPE